MTRRDAIKILDELKNSRNMINHGFAAGYAMVALYKYFESKNKNPELDNNSWEIVGILHDADYEITNKSLDLHTEEITNKLKELEADKLIIDAIRGHCDKEPRKTLLSKSIYACDELTGLIVACALVKPDKKLNSVTVKTIQKKFKDKSFAKGANRDQVKTCEKELAIPLEEFVKITLSAMQENSVELGL